MQDLYPNLPGYQTVLTGGNMVITSNVADTQSVLLIGTSVDGPVNQPVRITSMLDAEAIFGSMATAGVRNGSTLLLGYQEAVEAGCQNVRLLRYSGVSATTTITDNATTPVSLIKLTAKNAGSLYNTVGTSTIDGGLGVVASTSGETDTLTIKLPLGKGSDIIYTISATMTIPELVALINADANNAFVYAEMLGANTDTLASTIKDGIFKFTGGDNQIAPTVSEQKDLLHGSGTGESYVMGTYDILKDYKVDIIALLGVYADTGGSGTETDFVSKLANHCAEMSTKDNVTLGMISVSPFADSSLTVVSNAVKALLLLDNDYPVLDADGNTVYDTDGNAIDAGKYISIVVGEGIFKTSKLTSESYKNSLVAAYAGMVSALPAQSAPTNKSLSNVRGLSYSLSLSQLNDLTGKKFTTVRQKENGVYVVSGITCAPDGNVYQRLSSVRIIGVVVDAVVNVADPFIGEPNSLIHRNTLHTAIKSSLDALKSVGIITNYKFQLYATTSDLVNGILNVELEVVPAFELRKIKTTITLKTNL
jgi:hypothetical protein